MENLIEATPSRGGGSNGRNKEMKRLPMFATLLLVLLPISGVALFVVTDEFKNHTEIVVSNQEIFLHVAPTLVKEKLDRAVDVGVSLAGKTLLRQSIEKGQWDDALKSVETVSKKFPYIDAVNYSHRGAKVDVAVSLQKENILIEVVDTGVGIPEEEQIITFTKFFRGSNRGPESAAGDGLGLYLARAYMELLGGKVWFESEEGKGTTFFISLPVA